MCIALITTAHPSYALIAIDNRDEFLLRPTSRPHWWSAPGSPSPILSSRDLHRADQGTWLGITRSGLLAVLTNYRETGADADAASPPPAPIAGRNSRGRITTAFLSTAPGQSLPERAAHVLRDVGVHGVGGFSLLCGDLRGDLTGEGLAVLSNRAGSTADVPRVAQRRGGVWGLSNAVYSEDPAAEWPKVALGKRLLLEAVARSCREGDAEEDLVERLFGVLDTDTLPRKEEDISLSERMMLLRHSIFIPEMGDPRHREAMRRAVRNGSGPKRPPGHASEADQEAAQDLLGQENPPPQDPVTGTEGGEAAAPFEMGMYGTQRQTVILVDHAGRVVFTERALWDEHGARVAKGEGDVRTEFQIEGWNR